MGTPPESQGTVRWLAYGRTGFVSLLAAALIGANLSGLRPFPLAPVLALLAATCLLSAVYLLRLGRVRNPVWLAEVQIYGDIVLETVLIYLTGGPYSVFPFLYLVSILTASIVVAPRESFGVAAVAVLLHGVTLGAQFYRWLPPTVDHSLARNVGMEGSLTILIISANFCACFLMAYLGTYLAGRLRQARGEVHRSEASLVALRAVHEDIVQSVASGLLTFDRRGTVTSVNRTAEGLCARREAELRGTSWESLFPGAPPFPTVWEGLEGEGTLRTRTETELARPDGSRIPVGMSLSFLRRGRGAICSFEDLTDIKRMEEQVRQADRLAAIGRLAAGLAHEIRNPIGSIRGSVEVLRESLNPQGDDRRLMDIVLRESDRLDAIIRDFLQFSRPPHLVRVPTDLSAMLDEILLMLSNQGRVTGADAPAVRIRRDVSEPGVKAEVDPAQMRQALWNLCRNAVEAMPQGGELRVSVRTASSPAGRPLMEITVEDTGVGIAAAELTQVFEPFFTTKPHGTGLGLAIAHRIVEDHGGEIRVQSEPWRGSRFIISLPLSGGVDP
jgi:two-component system sensor histidine kinase PilS (NtrC family)